MLSLAVTTEKYTRLSIPKSFAQQAGLVNTPLEFRLVPEGLLISPVRFALEVPPSDVAPEGTGATQPEKPSALGQSSGLWGKLRSYWQER